MLTSILVSLVACNGKNDDTGFFDLYDPTVQVEQGDTAKEPSAEPDAPEPDNPNQPDAGEPGDPNGPDNPEPGNPNEADNPNGPDNPNDTGGGGQDSGDPDIDDDGDGYTENQGDCDDTPGSGGQINPGATDFPNDGQDQNCDGSDTALTQLPLLNPSFDTEDFANPGYPADWMNLGGAWGWQAHNSNIFLEGVDSGGFFGAHSPMGAALKLWGDYGANTTTPGESVVYQEFSDDGSWSPANKVFWLTAWGLHHTVDPVQGTAEAYAVIRCLDASGNIQGDAVTQSINAQTQLESWRNLSTWVQCNEFTTTVQAMLMFHQLDFTTDTGTVFFDDIDFSEAQ